MNKLAVFIILYTLIHYSAYAVQRPRSIAINQHIKVISYSTNDIHEYTGFYGYQSSILFEKGEEIKTIAMGDSSGWQLIPKGNRLFLKPLSENAKTNCTLITNRRVYYFALHAKEAKGLNDPALAYEVRFIYPILKLNTSNNNTVMTGSDTDANNKELLSKINFHYTVSGSTNIIPIKAFDDGVFTYLQFRDLNAEMPAVFLVDSAGYEELINFRIVSRCKLIGKPCMVIERVAARFTLRDGSDVACLFNEKMLKHTVQTRR